MNSNSHNILLQNCFVIFSRNMKIFLEKRCCQIFDLDYIPNTPHMIYLCSHGAEDFTSYSIFTSCLLFYPTVGGVCQGIEKGDKVIEYVVAQCPGCSGNDTETGWATIFTIFVEELRLTEVTNCSGNRCGV